MKISFPLLPLAFVSLLLLLSAGPAQAQTFQTLHSWDVTTYYPQTSLVKGNDGALYGTTERNNFLPQIGSGGGVVFRITPQGAFKVLHAFANNLSPTTSVVQGPDGAFYGMTTNGGANFAGTIYKVTADGTFAQLLDFNTTTASNPTQALTNGADGNLYGTTPEGGASGAGAFFRITPAGAYTLLASFTAATTGRAPGGRLLLHADGNFYGTANTGGTNNRGTIFKVTPAGAFTVLHHFPATGPGNPNSGLTLGADGNFYGRTNALIYRLTPQGAFTTVHTFVTATGTTPRGDLVPGSDGHLYGATIRGAANGLGGIFRLTTAGALTLLRSFNDNTYSGDFASVTEGEAGVLYGVTNGGPGQNRGSVFKVPTSGTPLTELHDFYNVAGTSPTAPLIEGDGGNLFSTATNDGNEGLVYRLSPAGVVTTLQASGYTDPLGIIHGGVTKGTDGLLYGVSEQASGNDGVAYKIAQTGGSATILNTFSAGRGGQHPRGQLTQAGDGNFYGITSFSGYNEGTVFKLTPAGALTTAYTFGGAAGAYPNSPLVIGSDNRLYGTTEDGGSSDRGVIFRVIPGATPAGATVATFINSNGQTPTGAIMLAADGNLYGTTLSGGTNNRGTVFRVTSAGVHSVFANLGTTTASRPRGAIVRASNGVLFGVTSEGGANGVGCVYSVSTAGVTSIIHSFATTGPRVPMNGLAIGPDNNFYGTTTLGGTGGLGTVFKITAAGVITHFRHFDYSTGDLPSGTLFRASNNAMYGLNQSGGTGGSGTLYRVALPPSPGIFAASLVRASTATLNGNVIPWVGPTTARFEYSTSPTFANNVIATPPVEITAGTTATTLTAPITGLAPGTTYYVRVFAQNVGGTATSTTVNFTTNTRPTGGTFTVNPEVALPGASVQLSAPGWTDVNTPLTYQFFVNGAPLGAATPVSATSFTAPATAGTYPVKVRVADALGDFTEVERTLRVEYQPPTVVTGGASLISKTGATISATVNAHGALATVAFDYGLTDAYGQTATAAPATVSGLTPQTVTATLQDLTPNTTYHFRVRAANAGGPSLGADATFTTAVNPPPAGGTFFWTRPVAVPGETVNMGVFSWTDEDLPLTYQFFFNGTPLGPPSGAVTASFQAPAALGTYPIKVRITDALGAFTERNGTVRVNNKPVARPATLGALAGSVAEIPAAKLLRYVSDPDGDTVEITGTNVSTAQGGTARLFLGVIYYTPPVGYTGPDSFTYLLRDSAGSTAAGTVNVTVAPADSPSLNVISITQTPAGFLVRFAGVPGEPYQIQYRDALTDPWQLLDPPGTILAGPNGIFEHEDKPNQKPAARFYRAVAP